MVFRTLCFLFLLTPLREGRPSIHPLLCRGDRISTHAPAGGATCGMDLIRPSISISTHAPAGGATSSLIFMALPQHHFYSRPCGRGDQINHAFVPKLELFLLTPLREGRRCKARLRRAGTPYFYSRPCGRGDVLCAGYAADGDWHFYSRPCGRGDCLPHRWRPAFSAFLLTPLREGRRQCLEAPGINVIFLLTPLREGRPIRAIPTHSCRDISTHAPAGGATRRLFSSAKTSSISTHAPAGGATSSRRE